MLPSHSLSDRSRTSSHASVVQPLRRLLALAIVLCGFGALSPAMGQAWNYRVLHTQVGPNDGISPASSLVQGADGNFYGTTTGGGPFNNGTIFKLTPAGALTTVYSFSGGGDGWGPAAGLVLGSDGNFYGTTRNGGTSNVGTIFKVTPAGNLTTLYGFAGGFTSSSDGGLPVAALIQGNDGNFYGTTFGGGTSDSGTVFEMTPAGSLTILHSFFPHTDGTRPLAALTQGSDGNFYGTTSMGGANDGGTVFKCTPAGMYTVLYSFDGEPPPQSQGASPVAPLVQGADGNFYGTTSMGGSDPASGTVFKITPAGTLTILSSFSDSNGGMPLAGLIAGSDGNFYGTTSSNGGSTVFEVTPGGTLTTLHTFSGSDGDDPRAALVLGSDGNFYGTTFAGGSVGVGTVFTLSAAGQFASIHSFSYSNDGANPSGPLLPASDGYLYGVTTNGGRANKGTVYKVNRDGTQTVLAAFTGDNGAQPNGALVQGADGNIYGVTASGGASNDGTVFRMTPTGVLTTMHAFSRAVDGSLPNGGLLLASDGDFYGVTNDGGASDEGTVFKIDVAGSLTVLHAFTFVGDDGSAPVGPLVEGSDGNFYGSALSGEDFLGRVFSMTPGGVVTLLHSFLYGFDGYQPNGGLIQGGDGSFYGTADYDGPDDGGTLFKFTTGGTFSVVHALNPVPDGSNPSAGLTLGKDGNFYGTASSGGANDTGTIYQRTAGGVFSVLYTFSATYGSQDNGDGANPSSSLVQGADGSFYGVTQYGGTAGAGTVFALSPGPHPAFFTGEVPLTNGVYYLAFAGGNFFGYYSYLTDPHYLYHFDLGYEYVFDAADGKGGVYLYDFASNDFFYTSPGFPFPYLYDFGLNSVVYYFPDPDHAGHYNTDGVRYFYVFSTGQTISK